ncbi:arsenate reductase [Candidatus Puniceispirillum sp.]|nr:arsenate reductase [Candidatus Puniceispirillum sp.]
MKLYGLKNCDSCKKALKEIRNAGKDIEFIDIRENGISLDIIQNWLDQHGDGVLVNRKSTTWRNLSDEARRTPAPILLQAHSTLIKRPIIVADDHSFVGWNVDVKSALGIA